MALAWQSMMAYGGLGPWFETWFQHITMVEAFSGEYTLYDT